MLETGKITSYQMALCVFPTVLATAILSMPAINHTYAGRDMWISPILGSSIGFITVWVLWRLHKQYPGETIFEYSRHIIGKTAGTCLSGLYVLFFLYLSGFIIREYADHIIISILPETPRIIIMSSFVLVAAFAINGGLATIGRAAAVFIPIFILPLPTLLLLLAKDFNPHELLPILENGMLPPIIGASLPQAWFSEVFIITMLLPHLRDRGKAMKWNIIILILILISMVLADIVALLLFGELTGNYTFPILKAGRYVSLMNFFEHMEALSLSIWITGAFIKISITFYTLTLGCAQWLNLKSYRPLVVPLGFLIVLFGVWEFYNFQEQALFTKTVLPLLFPLLFTGIPIVLLIIDTARKKGSRKGELDRKESLS